MSQESVVGLPEVFQALINLVGGVAYKLTGQVPVLHLQDQQGRTILYRPDLSAVEWKEKGQT